VPEFIQEHVRIQDLELATWPSAEAQAAAIADDIAYDAHDLDDGLRAGMFVADDLADVPLVSDILRDLRARFAEMERSRLANELTRRLINRMIEDVIVETERRAAETPLRSADDVRRAARDLVGFSAVMAGVDRAIKDFLTPRLYRHPHVEATTAQAAQVVTDLFAHFQKQPADLPAEWQAAADDSRATARRIADFIAGMTDRYALDQHRRFFDSTPDLR
jgi:dGTPase